MARPRTLPRRVRAGDAPHPRGPRARHYQKRGGHAAKVTFDEALVVINEPATDFVALDDVLEPLAKFDF